MIRTTKTSCIPTATSRRSRRGSTITSVVCIGDQQQKHERAGGRRRHEVREQIPEEDGERLIPADRECERRGRREVDHHREPGDEGHERGHLGDEHRAAANRQRSEHLGVAPIRKERVPDENREEPDGRHRVPDEEELVRPRTNAKELRGGNGDDGVLREERDRDHYRRRDEDRGQPEHRCPEVDGLRHQIVLEQPSGERAEEQGELPPLGVGDGETLAPGRHRSDSELRASSPRPGRGRPRRRPVARRAG